MLRVCHTHISYMWKELESAIFSQAKLHLYGWAMTKFGRPGYYGASDCYYLLKCKRTQEEM